MPTTAARIQHIQWQDWDEIKCKINTSCIYDFIATKCPLECKSFPVY